MKTATLQHDYIPQLGNRDGGDNPPDLLILPENDHELKSVTEYLASQGLIFRRLRSNVVGHEWYGKLYLEVAFCGRYETPVKHCAVAEFDLYYGETLLCVCCARNSDEAYRYARKTAIMGIVDVSFIDLPQSALTFKSFPILDAQRRERIAALLDKLI